MPFLTKTKRKFDEIKSPLPKIKQVEIDKESLPSKSESIEIDFEHEKIKELEFKLKEKEDLVRRLKLVKHYKTRVIIHI